MGSPQKDGHSRNSIGKNKVATANARIHEPAPALACDERHRLFREGATRLTDEGLLSLILAGPARETLRLAHEAILEVGSLRALLELPAEQLGALRGFGPDQAILITAALELGRRYIASSIDRGDPLEDPRASATFFTARLRHLDIETFAVLFLDNRHQVLQYEELARGSVDGCRVHAREVVRRALYHNASAVVFAHNHPSGVAEPSHADRVLTGELASALALVDVRVLDHLIVGEGESVSFVERGLL